MRASLPVKENDGVLLRRLVNSLYRIIKPEASEIQGQFPLTRLSALVNQPGLWDNFAS
jgi:hypothetical protein